jgi:hypothetical protein
MEVLVRFDEWNASFFLKDNQQPFLQGVRKTRGIGYIWKLVDHKGNTIGTFKYKWKLFGYSKKYEIIFQPLISDSPISFFIYFRPFPAPHYKASIKDEKYLIVQHKGRLLSVFKDKLQVGLLEEQALHIGYETSFKIKFNDDADLYIACVLAYTVILNKPVDESVVNVNLGNIGPELRRLDSLWKPTSKQRNE